MIKFITTKSISSSIDTIITEAEDELFIISPYLRLSKYYLDRLELTAKKGVNITFIYGKKEINKLTKDTLMSLKNIKLAYREPLHAKCFMNEKSLLISSMNLHEYSENYNDEMGLLVERSDARKVILETRKEIMRILELSTIMKNSQIIQDIITRWTCIRCGCTISKNLDKPFCAACWTSWDYWRNGDFPEKYCHHCSKEFESSKHKPLCAECSKLRNKNLLPK